MQQTEARKILKDAPIMWRRINSIGVILDCNSTYASKIGYPKSEILGRTIFEHVPKEEHEKMHDSLKVWFETGQVVERRINFKKQDGTVFQALLYASSLYDEKDNLMGSNTVIFDINDINDQNIADWEDFIDEAEKRLEDIQKGSFDSLDENSKSEYNGLKKMFDMLNETDLKSLKEIK